MTFFLQVESKHNILPEKRKCSLLFLHFVYAVQLATFGLLELRHVGFIVFLTAF